MLQEGCGVKSEDVAACSLTMDASENQKHYFRKLQMRVAPCWRSDESLKESEHSSLQLSSTQSPSTAENDLGNRRTPADSFSSLSSPLDHSSVLKEDADFSPMKVVQKAGEHRSPLGLGALQKRAETLTQKLQRRERQCIALREALERCNHQFRKALGSD